VDLRIVIGYDMLVSLTERLPGQLEAGQQVPFQRLVKMFLLARQAAHALAVPELLSLVVRASNTYSASASLSPNRLASTSTPRIFDRKLSL